MEIPTIKIDATHPDQGDYVIINEEDFDPAVHARYIEGIEFQPNSDPENTPATKRRGRPPKAVDV